MKSIGIYTLTSALHDEKSVESSTQRFLDSIGISHEFFGDDYSSYGQYDLSLIYVRTGGTEGIFARLLPRLLEQSDSPIYLLTSGESNSLAASMEILSYLQQRSINGEIIHGKAQYIANRIELLRVVEHAKKHIRRQRLGVIGHPSDWLISSETDYDIVKENLGISLIDIEMTELLEEISRQQSVDVNPKLKALAPSDDIKSSLSGAECIYQALKVLVKQHNLNGLTLRCFDLLGTVRNTGCLALARLNSVGIVSSCEGDIPALLSMVIAQALTGVTGFQANPSSIDPETGTITFAHCTIPLNLVSRIELDTHFESGLGVGIRGYMPEGEVTVFKTDASAKRYFSAGATLLRSEAKPNLCRTQQVLQFHDHQQAMYFLTNPIGNHHIIVPGNHEDSISQFFKQ